MIFEATEVPAAYTAHAPSAQEPTKRVFLVFNNPKIFLKHFYIQSRGFKGHDFRIGPIVLTRTRGHQVKQTEMHPTEFHGVWQQIYWKYCGNSTKDIQKNHASFNFWIHQDTKVKILCIFRRTEGFGQVVYLCIYKKVVVNLNLKLTLS